MSAAPATITGRSGTRSRQTSAGQVQPASSRRRRRNSVPGQRGCVQRQRAAHQHHRVDKHHRARSGCGKVQRQQEAAQARRREVDADASRSCGRRCRAARTVSAKAAGPRRPAPRKLQTPPPFQGRGKL